MTQEVQNYATLIAGCQLGDWWGLKKNNEVTKRQALFHNKDSNFSQTLSSEEAKITWAIQ